MSASLPLPAAAAPAADLPVAIVGAGFSGTLLAVNLLRMGARVVLIERDNAHLARGLAYGTRRPEHLLNVRASNMSAFPDDPGHFLRWMGFASSAQHNRFVPRLAYGRYVRELLFAALAATPGRIAVKQQEAVDIAFDGAAPTLVLDSGERVAAFPLDEDYEKALESKVADIKQCTMEGEADHILAARFLRRFTHGRPWIHVDLSAASCEGGLGPLASRLTGFGVAWGVQLLVDRLG